MRDAIARVEAGEVVRHSWAEYHGVVSDYSDDALAFSQGADCEFRCYHMARRPVEPGSLAWLVTPCLARYPSCWGAHPS